jgi:Trk K+ transport system NAD-binding subunit
MPGSRGFGILLIIFVATLIYSLFDIYFFYINPETGERLDLAASAYAVFALLVFETPFPFPLDFSVRVVFFLVPIMGILVLGQGILRLGRTLTNKNLWNRAMASTYKEHIIICGLGKVGYKVVRWILDLNEEVVVIENRADSPFVAEVRSWGVPIIIADARRAEVLEEAGIRYAESIVPCTNDDLVNLSIALEARRIVPDIKVVLRMFNDRMAANLETGFDIHTVFSTPDLSAPAFAAAATKAPLDYAFSYGEGKDRSLLTITKFTIVPESILNGYSVGQLETEFQVAVIAHRHAGEFKLHPPNHIKLIADDRFVVSASIEALNEIASLTPPTREMDLYEQGRWPILNLEEYRANKRF